MGISTYQILLFLLLILVPNFVVFKFSKKYNRNFIFWFLAGFLISPMLAAFTIYFSKEKKETSSKDIKSILLGFLIGIVCVLIIYGILMLIFSKL